MATITDKGMQAKPTDKDQWILSPFKRGSGVFVGRISPSGERLFYFRYTKPNGNRRFYPIGSYHQKGIKGLTLTEAYSKACELSVLYRNGIKNIHEYFKNELERQRIEKEEEHLRKIIALENAEKEKLRKITVRQLFDRWVSVELKPQIRADGSRIGRKDSGKYTLNQFERRVFPSIGEMNITEVRKSDLVAILDKAKSEGKRRTCNMLLADMKQMFRFAQTRELVELSPLVSVSKRDAGGADVERTRTLSIDELKALSIQIKQANLSKRTEIAVFIMLATGCRVGEISNAKWDQIDLSGAKWFLPDTKNQRSHTIHLSPFAINCFEKLQALRELESCGSLIKWVLPSQDGKHAICAKSIGKQLADRQRVQGSILKNRCKLNDALNLKGGKWTSHDLRRTCATLMAQIGVSTDVIDECLNHKLQRRISRVYIHDRRSGEQEKAFNALGKKLDEIFNNVNPYGKIFQLESRRA